MLDDTFSRQAKRLIDRYGTRATLTRQTKGAFDPVTGTYGPGETNTYSIKTSAPDDFEQDTIDGTLVQTGDFKVQIAAADIPIAPDLSTSDTQDTFTLDGKDYSIVRVWPIYGGDDVVLYRLQVRA